MFKKFFLISLLTLGQISFAQVPKNVNVWFTSVNTSNLSCNATCQSQGFDTVMTLTLPVGSFLITGNFEVQVAGNGQSATCFLKDSAGLITLPGQTATGNTFSSLSMVVSLQAAETYSSSTTVTLNCSWTGTTLTAGPGTMSAIQISSITRQ